MVYLGGALGVNTYLMYGFFNTVPQSLDEAAKIDGASHAQIFFGIIMRLVTPILAVVGLLTFIGISGEFVIASVVLTDPDSQTLAVGLYSFVAQQRLGELGRLRRRRRALRHPGDGPVPVPAALHRQRPHRGLGEGLGMSGALPAGLLPHHDGSALHAPQATVAGAPARLRHPHPRGVGPGQPGLAPLNARRRTPV